MPLKPIARHAAEESSNQRFDRLIDELSSPENSRKEYRAMLQKSDGVRVEVHMTGALHRKNSPIRLLDLIPRPGKGYPLPPRIVYIDTEAMQHD